jgi:hypothetical protein
MSIVDFFTFLKGQAKDMILLGKSLGTSYLRLVPKLSGIRPIVNMGRKQEGGKASINKQLENAFHIIKLGKVPAVFMTCFLLGLFVDLNNFMNFF